MFKGMFFRFLLYFSDQVNFIEVYNLEFNEIKDVYNETHQRIFNDKCKLSQQKTILKKSYINDQKLRNYRTDTEMLDYDTKLDNPQLYPSFLRN